MHENEERGKKQMRTDLDANGNWIEKLCYYLLYYYVLHSFLQKHRSHEGTHPSFVYKCRRGVLFCEIRPQYGQHSFDTNF